MILAKSYLDSHFFHQRDRDVLSILKFYIFKEHIILFN